MYALTLFDRLLGASRSVATTWYQVTWKLVQFPVLCLSIVIPTKIMKFGITTYMYQTTYLMINCTNRLCAHYFGKYIWDICLPRSS